MAQVSHLNGTQIAVDLPDHQATITISFADGREQAKAFVRKSPELKEVFSGAGAVAKTLATEQAAALYAEESALGKIKSQLAAFRVK